MLTHPQIDYGNISPSLFNKSIKQTGLLAYRETHLITYCDEPSVIINEISGIPNKNGFLFGEISQVNIIAYQAWIDGHLVSIGKVSSPDSMLLKYTEKKKIIINDNDLITPVSDGKPIKGKIFSVILRVTPIMSQNEFKNRYIDEITSHVSITILGDNSNH